MKLKERYNLDNMGNGSQEIVYEAIETTDREGRGDVHLRGVRTGPGGVDLEPRHPPLLHFAAVSTAPRPAAGAQDARGDGPGDRFGPEEAEKPPAPRITREGRGGSCKTGVGPGLKRIGLAVPPPTKPPRNSGPGGRARDPVARRGDAEDPLVRLRCRGVTVEARSLVARTRYDIVFVDVNLPDGSGLALAEEATNAPLVDRHHGAQ